MRIDVIGETTMVPTRPPAKPLEDLEGLRLTLQALVEDSIAPKVNATSPVGELDRFCTLGTTTGPTRSENEDRVCAVTISRGRNPVDALFLALVCDGIGGMQDGEASARKAIAAFVAACAVSTSDSLSEILNTAAVAADKEVHALTKGRGGTTLVALLMSRTSEEVAAVNCGDSRLFRLTGREMAQVTEDQTLGAALRNAAGENLDLDHRGLELSNFVGIGPGFFPQFVELSNVDQPCLGYVLATDGTWNALGSLFETVVVSAPSHVAAIQRTLAIVNYAAGPDNASIAITKPRAQVAMELAQLSRKPNLVLIQGATAGRNFSVALPLVPRASTSTNVELAKVPPTRVKTQKRGRKKQQRLLVFSDAALANVRSTGVGAGVQILDGDLDDDQGTADDSNS